LPVNLDWGFCALNDKISKLHKLLYSTQATLFFILIEQTIHSNEHLRDACTFQIDWKLYASQERSEWNFMKLEMKLNAHDGDRTWMVISFKQQPEVNLMKINMYYSVLFVYFMYFLKQMIRFFQSSVQQILINHKYH
jgi:hypothetical protein